MSNYKGNLSRVQAIATVGEEAVVKAEKENCEPTNRVGFCGNSKGDDMIEWKASFKLEDGRIINVYYYTDEIDEETATNADNWDFIEWDAWGYEVEGVVLTQTSETSNFLEKFSNSQKDAPEDVHKLISEHPEDFV